MKDLHELVRFQDSLSFLFVQHCRIEQDSKSIAVWREDGIIPIPAASLSTLLLGPGTVITHAAMKSLADNGCSIVWTGDEMVRTYACGTGETRHSRNLLKQAYLATREEYRLDVVTRMYALRFDESLKPGLTLRQIRGMEGARVRDTYNRMAKDYGVRWQGRNYDRRNWSHGDPVNRALSAANACLYGLCHAAVVSLGYSPALGFIHTGKQLSFIYDIADLYKTEVTIPASFQAAAEGSEDIEARVRHRMRIDMKEARILDRIPKDIHHILDIRIHCGQDEDQFADDPAKPAWLWEPSTGLDVPLPIDV